MTEPRRLLVGYDGSRASRAALAWAEATAREHHGRLAVVTVLSHPWLASAWPATATAPPLSELERNTCAMLRQAIDELAPDVSVTSCVLDGPVGASLAREARRQDCDAIVIGRGRRLLRPWPGLVERYLRRHCAVPVVAITASERSATTRPAPIDAPDPTESPAPVASLGPPGVRPAL